jgi:hypothetical protein
VAALRGAKAAAGAAPAAAEPPTDDADARVAHADAPNKAPVEAPDEALVDDDTEAATDADAEVVASALRGVDWAAVRAATAERTADATRTVRTMAEQVDWGRMQPVAARVSSSLIAAVASGQLGIGGPLGSTVARAIVDQRLTQRVAERWSPAADALPAALQVDPAAGE